MSLPHSPRASWRILSTVLACVAALAAAGWRAAPAAPQTGSADPNAVPGVGTPDQPPTGVGAPDQAGEQPPADETSGDAKKIKKKLKKAEEKADDAAAEATKAAEDATKAKEAAQAAAQAALVTGLRQGGYTLVVRHAETAAATPDKASADPDNENLERQLDPAGKEAAKMLGVSIRALDIPVGELLSSPAYRARETVILTRFGDPVVDPALDEGAQGMAGKSDMSSAEWLKQTVAKLPRRGTNRLVVTHLPVIVAAFGKDAADIAPCETLVVKPDGEGNSSIVGRLKIEEFEKLAGK